MFIENLQYIKRINSNGVQLLIRNVSSLGQCLTNISFLDKTAKSSAGGLSRTLLYFKLMELGTKEFMECVERDAMEFGYEELRIVLENICDEEVRGVDNGGDGSRILTGGYDETADRLKDYFIKKRT